MNTTESKKAQDLEMSNRPSRLLSVIKGFFSGIKVVARPSFGIYFSRVKNTHRDKNGKKRSRSKIVFRSKVD